MRNIDVKKINSTALTDSIKNIIISLQALEENTLETEVFAAMVIIKSHNQNGLPSPSEKLFGKRK